MLLGHTSSNSLGGQAFIKDMLVLASGSECTTGAWWARKSNLGLMERALAVSAKRPSVTVDEGQFPGWDEAEPRLPVGKKEEQL